MLNNQDRVVPLGSSCAPPPEQICQLWYVEQYLTRVGVHHKILLAALLSNQLLMIFQGKNMNLSHLSGEKLFQPSLVQQNIWGSALVKRSVRYLFHKAMPKCGDTLEAHTQQALLNIRIKFGSYHSNLAWHRKILVKWDQDSQDGLWELPKIEVSHLPKPSIFQLNIT